MSKIKIVSAQGTGFQSTFSGNGSGSSSSTLGFFHLLNFANCFCSDNFCKFFEFLCPLTASPSSGATISNKSALILFVQLGLCFYFKKGDRTSPMSFCISTKTSSTLSCMSSKNGEISWTLSNHFVWSISQKWLHEILRNRRTTHVKLTDTK